MRRPDCTGGGIPQPPGRSERVFRMKYPLSFLCAMAWIGSPLGASDFWNSTKPAAWSDGQTQEFLTKSPWVRYFGDLHAPGDYIRPGRVSPSPVPVGSLAIRWESAALVRDALTRIESKEYNDALARFSKDYYVIAVVSVWWGGSQTAQTRLSGHWSPEQEEELRDAIARRPPRHGLSGPPAPPIPVLIGNEQAARAFSVSRLSRPGYEAISPARVESGERARGTVVLIMFPRSLALESGTGDLEFSTTVKLGMASGTTFRARFSLKALAAGSERGL